MAHQPKIYTLEEANAFLPKVIELLPQLRKLRHRIIGERDRCDVEEITSYGATEKLAGEARDRIDQHSTNIRRYERDFEKQLKSFDEIGCDVKSLDPGLVDFYSQMHGNLVYLCWKEGEMEIKFWHTLYGGYSGRQPLP